MIPFVILADLRTGSTLLGASLDQHPEIRCYGEIFHPERFRDNEIPGCDRFASTGGEMVARALGAPGVQAAGFRAMIFLPRDEEPHWADSWSALGAREDLRVIELSRRDRRAQYASLLVAQSTRIFHPSPGDPILEPENRPRVTIDPGELRRWSRERDLLRERRRRELGTKPWLELLYEDLTACWTESIRLVQEFLRVEPLALAPAKSKQETRPLREVIANYDELGS